MSNFDMVLDTPGLGGAIAGAAVVILVTCYGLTIRWISRGEEEPTDQQ